MTFISQWNDLTKPRRFTEILGNEKVIRKMNIYFKNNKTKQIILVHGPVGVGKTTAINLLLQENNYHVITIAMSEINNKKMQFLF